MDKYILLIALLSVAVDDIHCLTKSNKRLSRSKRYIAFPEGSTLSIAICMVSQFITLPSQIFTEALNWGVSYELPNISSTLNLLPQSAAKRRNRRDLYRKMEVIMDSMGYNGRSCVLRALCETATIMTHGHVLEEILKTIFRYPLDKIFYSEPEVYKDYQTAYIVGEKEGSAGCSRSYLDCTFSLLDFALKKVANNP